jgi:dihydroorotate dehydrogenase
MNKQELAQLATVLLKYEIDGVIATNTTIHRENLENAPFSEEKGGLSGCPLQERSTQVIIQLKHILQDKIPIIACGGIMDEQAAQEKITAGAKLIQLYTGLIYNGPALIKKINAKIKLA